MDICLTGNSFRGDGVKKQVEKKKKKEEGEGKKYQYQKLWQQQKGGRGDKKKQSGKGKERESQQRHNLLLSPFDFLRFWRKEGLYSLVLNT